MYDFKIRVSGKDVFISGFPEVDYGMTIEDLARLVQVINDFLYTKWIRAE